MKTYAFFFGNTPDLSFAELQIVLSRLGIAEKPYLVNPSLAFLERETLDSAQLITMLGGVVKMGKKIAEFDFLDSEEIGELLLESKSAKITFGISGYAPLPFSLVSFLEEIKNHLTEKGIKSRFVLPKEDNILSSVVVEKQKINELCLFQINKKWIVVETLHVQAFEAWGVRDYDRPHSSPNKGMLPPKIARMMVNIGLGEKDSVKQNLLDPFCGMGTVLAEGLMVGAGKAIGIDIEQQSVENTRDNLKWLRNFYHLQNDYELFHGDATHASEYVGVESIDCIATEPLMGPLFEKRGNDIFVKGKKIEHGELKNIKTGLERLYKGCLKNWYSILKAKGRVAMIIPVFEWRGKTDDALVKNIIDTCEKLGYTQPVVFYYQRSGAFVRRAICIFTKN